jgi:DNA-binding PadR family transcriptional regulator
MKGDHLGEFEELVLLVISGSDEDAYGVAIKETLDRETGREVSLGAVYAALERLAGKGLVVSHEVEGPAVRGGRRRRAFEPTSEGRRVLRQMRAVRERLWRHAHARGR